jgi:hypothetical protein
MHTGNLTQPKPAANSQQPHKKLRFQQAVQQASAIFLFSVSTTGRQLIDEFADGHRLKPNFSSSP